MKYVNDIDARLGQLLEEREPKLLFKSMKYSVMAGGKRLRPVLCMMAAEMAGGDAATQALDIACAIEMIHTYSLIHDDLPAVDNDSMRRGRPTSHVVFGEAQAILAGDGLLTYAFETMLANAAKYPENMAKHLKAISHIARAAGVSGMVAGQVVDVDLSGEEANMRQLEYIYENKTAAMIRGSLLAGLALGDATEEEENAISAFGKALGISFQIIDDILDVEGKDTGKTPGRDAAAGKTTYVTLYGVDGSRTKAREVYAKGESALKVFGKRSDALLELCASLLAREK